jgi:serine protease Do
MTSKYGRWSILALIVLLAGGVSLALAGEETEKEKEKLREHSMHWISMDGHAKLGVHVSDVDAEKARQLQLPGEYGAVIEKVDDDSPAGKAGLAEGDVILSFASERVRSVAHLRRLVRETPPGRSVNIEVSRDGERRSLEVTPEAHHARLAAPGVRIGSFEIPHLEKVPRLELPEMDAWFVGAGPRLGITGSDVTPQLAGYFGVEQGKGVLVQEVLAGSAAERAGLKAGDVVVGVDDKPVTSVRELRGALRRAGDDREVTLTIVRDRQVQTLNVTLDEPKTRSRRHIAKLDIHVDPEAYEEWTHEMKSAAKEWKHDLDEWRHDLEQELKQREQEWGKELREAEKGLRESLESEEFQKEMRRLKDELRRHLRPQEGEVTVL